MSSTAASPSNVENIKSLELKISDEVINHLTTEEPLLPRTAWNDQIKHLRILFRIKKSLDEIEKNIIKESFRSIP
jgi:hypothetical protein